ncbi:helix-turn-helix transcriptional regulator [Saccharomonospora xinjiangensis]|uniref:helix-turn-helix transcriptional regulator n=1 Tax=Saccharomonospora xinjiangensis TaxID=75294 RepID=UPI00351015EA
MDETFGKRLRRLREQAGFSQPALARLVPISQSSLSRYESGHQMVARDIAERLDELLDAGGALTATLTPTVLHGPDIDRERLAHIAARPRSIDAAGLDALADVLAATRRLEDAVGAVSVLTFERGHVNLMTELAADAHGSIRQRVVNLAGQWAQHHGWLHTALKRYDEADAWFGRALEWAIESGDEDLTATVWSFKGHVAWLRGNLGPAIGFTEVARRYRNVYAGQSAYDALQAARAYAATGDAYAVDKLCDEAVELSTRALDELPGAPPWHYYRSPAFWDLERGRAVCFLPGRAQQAADLLAAGLDALPPDQRAADWVMAYRRDLLAAQARCG